MARPVTRPGTRPTTSPSISSSDRGTASPTSAPGRVGPVSTSLTKTGCQVVGTDLPFEGLRRAQARAATDGLAGRASYVMATGSRQPFRPGSFDAVVHSDVLCCLSPKLAVLRACRQLLRPGGRMAFTTIHVSRRPRPDPSSTRPQRRAAACGDATAISETCSRRPDSVMSSRSTSPSPTPTRSEPGTRPPNHVPASFGHSPPLHEFEANQADRRLTLAAIDEGLLQRSLFTARVR